jgi:CHAD domain-containing protein
VRETLEREVKLVPPPDFVLPELGGLRLPTRTFVSTYHDTPQLVLARHGITFRHRIEDGAGLWQLKIPHGAARIELETGGPPARPPEELMRLLPAFLRGREIVPIARLRTRRESVRTAGVEVVDDAVAVLEGQHVRRRFRELEMELLDGDEDALRRIEKELRLAGAEPRELRPKVFEALDYSGALEPVAASKDATPAEELAAALSEQMRRLLRHDPGTRLGSDPEDLHQMRVATRRLRAFLRAGRPLLEEAWAESLRAELGWLGGELGPTRDLDVMLERLRDEAVALADDGDAAAPLLAEVEAERETAHAAALEALSGDRYLALLERLDGVGEPPLSGDDVPLAHIWRSELKRTAKAFARLGDDAPDDELHAARIRVKRVRYAAELAEPELGRRGRAFVDEAKRLQDVLGEHQDAVVAEERVRAWAEATPGGRFAAGRLVERARGRKETARHAWPEGWDRLRRAAKKVKR